MVKWPKFPSMPSSGQLRGKLCGFRAKSVDAMVVLSDTRNSHNFLNQPWVSRFGLKIEEGAWLNVKIGKARSIHVWVRYQAPQPKSKGTHFSGAFWIGLEGYDAVLGAQWLKTHYFSLLTMANQQQGQPVTLIGLGTPSSKEIGRWQMVKETRGEQRTRNTDALGHCRSFQRRREQ